MPITAAQVQLGYLAYYGRPADPLGLNYWLAAGSGPSVGLPFLAALANTPQWDAVKAQGATTVLNTIYQNLFGRNVDSPGLAYWAGELAAGRVDLNTIAVKIIEVALSLPASNVDRQTMIARQDTAVAFTNAVDTPAEIAAYNSAAAFANAAAFMATIGTTPATPAQVDAAVANAMVVGNVGATFTLTVGVDLADTASSSRSGIDTSSQFKFTSGNEKIIAGAGTLGIFDVLLDATTTDNDVMEYTAEALNAPTMTNIETIKMNVAVANAGLNMAAVSGTKAIEVTGTQNGRLVNINGTSAPTITLKDYNKTFTAALTTAAGTTAGGNAESLKFILNGTGSKAKLTLDTATASGNLEALSIESAGTAKNTLELTLADANSDGFVINLITKTTLTGAADLDLKVAHAVINGQEMDASGMTGKFNLTVDRNGAGTATTNLTNVKGYQGLTIVDSTAGGDNLVLSGVATGTTITLANAFAAAAGSIAVKGAASKTDDTLTLVLDHSTDATDIDVNGASDLTINDVETITIKSEGGTSTGNKIQQLVTSAGAKIKVDGSTKLDLGLKSAVSSIEIAGSGKHKVAFQAPTAYGEGKNLAVDASAATSETTIDLSKAQGTDGGVAETITITGSAQKDTITTTKQGAALANHALKFVIDAGAGNDVVEVGLNKNFSHSVTLGAGSDELKLTPADTVATLLDVDGTTAGDQAPKHVIVNDFQLGSGGDKLSVNTVGAMTFGGLKTGTALTAADNAKLWILDTAVASDANFTGNTAGDVFKALAVSGGVVEEAAVLAINNASGVAELWYFYNTNNDGNVNSGEVVKLATFENITTVGVLTDATSGFIAANFGTWA